MNEGREKTHIYRILAGRGIVGALPSPIIVSIRIIPLMSFLCQVAIFYGRLFLRGKYGGRRYRYSVLNIPCLVKNSQKGERMKYF